MMRRSHQNEQNKIIYDVRPNIIDYVFHFAAYAAEGLSPFIRKYNYENNLVATSRIVNNCIKYNVKKLIFASSMAVYGHGDGNIFDENQIPKPIDPYGVAKYGCEIYINNLFYYFYTSCKCRLGKNDCKLEAQKELEDFLKHNRN